MKKSASLAKAILTSIVAMLLMSLQSTVDTIQTQTSKPEAAPTNALTNADFTEPALLQQKLELPMTTLEYNLSLVVLGFGVLLIAAEIYVVRSRNICAEDTIKLIVITVIIVSTLFLITAGYSNDQIAPAMGLLGTIAGYLLGKINPTNTKSDEKA